MQTKTLLTCYCGNGHFIKASVRSENKCQEYRSKFYVVLYFDTILF